MCFAAGGLVASALWGASPPSFVDRYRDGTPAFLRLDEEADRDAFRRWFTALSEIEYFAGAHGRAPEIIDCSSLIRFAYREALRRHDSAWAASSGLRYIPSIPSVAKYSWPHTPVGASLFRIRPGPFAEDDLHSGAFAQFANAAALQRYNTFLVSRDTARAQPGDLLFYYRAGAPSPFHSMIFVGRSFIRPSPELIVVYDTGPSSGAGGEIRRRTLNELLHYPDPQWQPRESNPYFLGVYRWNILR